MRRATSQQAKSRSSQTGPWILWKELFYWCKNHADKVLMISIKFLFKDSKSGHKGEVPASSIKRNQNIFNSLIHWVYQRYKKELLNCQRSHLKPPSRDLARTVYTAKNLIILLSYSATSGIQWLWVKIGKESSDWYPSIKSKKQFKSQLKMLRIFSGSMGSWQTWSSNSLGSAAVLKQEK